MPIFGWVILNRITQPKNNGDRPNKILGKPIGWVENTDAKKLKNTPPKYATHHHQIAYQA